MILSVQIELKYGTLFVDARRLDLRRILSFKAKRQQKGHEQSDRSDRQKSAGNDILFGNAVCRARRRTVVGMPDRDPEIQRRKTDRNRQKKGAPNRGGLRKEAVLRRQSPAQKDMKPA